MTNNGFTLHFIDTAQTTSLPFRRLSLSLVKAIHCHICLHEFLLSESEKLLPTNRSQKNTTCQNVGKQKEIMLVAPLIGFLKTLCPSWFAKA